MTDPLHPTRRDRFMDWIVGLVRVTVLLLILLIVVGVGRLLVWVWQQAVQAHVAAALIVAVSLFMMAAAELMRRQP